MEATIDLGLLSVFHAVARSGSFTDAAKTLRVTKGTVSRGIAALEEKLGAELLHRTTRSVALTSAGTALFERTGPHLRALNDAVCRLPELEDTPSGELKLTCPTDFSAVMADLVHRFCLRYPQVRVNLELSNRMVNLVSEGFDLAIRAAPGPLKSSTLVMRRLVPVAAWFYASPAYLARSGPVRELGDPAHSWVVLTGLKRTLKVPKDFAPRVQSNDFSFIRDCARAGAGVAMLPSFLAEALVESGELVKVLPSLKAFGGGFVLLYPSSGQVARKTTAFRDFIVDHFKRQPLPA